MTDDSGDLVVPLTELDPERTGKYRDDARGWQVLAANGVPTGSVHDLLVDTRTGAAHAVVVEVTSDSDLGSSSFRVLIPAAQARLDPAERRVHLDSLAWTEVALLPHYGEDAATGEEDTVWVSAPPPAQPSVADEVRMTLFEEQLDIRTVSAGAGEVVVTKRVETEQVREVVPTMREDVVIERRPLPPGAGLEPRTEGDVTYVPLVREEIVVQKRLVAHEELVIRKRQVVEEQVVEETVRREVVEVQRPGEEPKAV